MAKPALLLAIVALIAAGCASGTPDAPAVKPAVDDAFLVRIGSHQDTALALAQAASRAASRPEVKRLAKRMAQTRERLRPAVQTRLAEVPPGNRLADLGVTPEQAGEAIHADALTGAKPFDAAFLTVMQRHDRGALALAKAEIARGGDAEVKALARQLEVALAGELNDVAQALTALARDASSA
ncbi:MAG TPA: DUF305 domain-containing protein [Solirubrobacter sp.]